MVFTYGPGAIVDLRTPKGSSVSGIMRSLDNWQATAGKAYGGKQAQKLILERLKKIINDRYNFDIIEFRWPPVELLFKNDEFEQPFLESIRLPTWLTCPRCNTLKKARKWKTPFGDHPDRECQRCQTPVVPTRFIIACDNGHIDDFDYLWWLENRGTGGSEKGCKTKQTSSGEIIYHPELKLNQGGSLSLASMSVECKICKRKASMAGIFEKDLNLKCFGNKEWAEVAGEDCYLHATVQQRSSRSIYFPMHESALDIPPYNDLPNVLGSYWRPIHNAVTADAGEEIEGRNYLRDYIVPQIEDINDDLQTDFTAEQLINDINDHYQNVDMADKNPRVDEFKRLNDRSYDRQSYPDILLHFENVPEKFERQIENLVRVLRLREIRALIGFSRKKSNNKLNNLWKNSQKWLPAIETNGEGIFFSFRQEFMEELKLKYSEERLSSGMIQDWYRRTENADPFVTRGPTRDVSVGLEFIFLHTLSHIIMRQLSLDSGYSTPSLHERIFCGDDMNGILIYTASVDSEGTLGGLSRIGKSENFEKLLTHALAEADFCSSDPLCSAGDMSVSEPLNGASCYCCSILPETCCDHFNLLLDRTLLKHMKI